MGIKGFGSIDASIWHFQTQAGKGGSNPALRTLYYRLLRLLSLSIKPLFVFDGPNKPPFKRNVKTGTTGAALPNFISKQLLQLFGFPYHTAPGEAEAECALLQKEGIVDAVLSEDVDTMMFGCTLHLRNWSSENVRRNKTPSHVNVYRAATTRQGKSGLDSEGMILVALMSGGDYIPAGIPGCGIKTACEAARAGFGRDLCRLSKSDTVGFNQWRERLQYELRVNESGFFRARHTALSRAIPDDFPDKTVLRYYTNPTVSKAVQIERLRNELKWEESINVPGLRNFVAEAFEWVNLSGAKKFVRGLAPAMLVDRLCRRYNTDHTDDDLQAQESQEKEIMTAICGRRSHFITDAVPELRIAYTPIDIVGLDLAAENADDEPVDLVDSENEAPDLDNSRSRSRSPTKRTASTYDPAEPEKIWILESYAKFGVPLIVENWEETMRDPKKFATRKAREGALVGKKGKKPGGMKVGAMDAFVKAMKPGIEREIPVKSFEKPMGFLIPSIAGDHATIGVPSPRKTRDEQPRPRAGIEPATPKKLTLARAAKLSPRTIHATRNQDDNPWSLAKRPSDTLKVKLPPGTRFSALGIYGSSTPSTPSSSSRKATDEGIEGSQQLFTPTSSNSRRRRHSDPMQAEGSNTTAFRRVNRKLDFTSEGPPVTSSRPTTPDSLPSPSTLMYPLRRDPSEGIIPNETSQLEPTDLLTPGIKRVRALLALRESLDGTWRDIQPSERKRGYIKTVYDNVEVIDLTKS
ncbi:MAG: hypothetical protein L6R40_006718 [Gallowayella cf. fulva]|nr:MAG: hypothetical protein L6R40_006718 [Xanthomendoza cf. fulva]